MVEAVRRRQKGQRRWWRIGSFKELRAKELYGKDLCVCVKELCVCACVTKTACAKVVYDKVVYDKVVCKIAACERDVYGGKSFALKGSEWTRCA